jgi:hypothetical protein
MAECGFCWGLGAWTFLTLGTVSSVLFLVALARLEMSRRRLVHELEADRPSPKTAAQG